MTGGLIQLILKGIEDNFLTNNPEITFLKQYLGDILIFLLKRVNSYLVLH